MALVKVIRNGQITIPKKLRNALSIREGDLLEIELSKHGLYVQPKAVVDKKLAKDKFFRMVEEISKNSKQIDPEKLDSVIAEAVESAKSIRTQGRNAKADD